MNKFSLIFLGALAIFMAGCSKNVYTEQNERFEDAWIYDLDMPVPIRFSAGVLASKASIDDADDLVGEEFAFFALDKKAAISPENCIMDNAPARCYKENDVAKFAFKGKEADTTYYYPMQTENCYTFYGYHPASSSPQWKEGSISVHIDVATHTDVLWGKAEATQTVASNGFLYDGFNATYIRKVGKHPKFVFKHPTSCLKFRFTRVKSLENESNDDLVLKHAYLRGIPTRAELCIADEAGDNAGNFIQTWGQGNASIYGSSDTADEGLHLTVDQSTEAEELFIVPQADPLTLVLKFMVKNGMEQDMEVKYQISPDQFGLDCFEAGKKYGFNIIVYSPVRVDIQATVDGYEEAFGDGGYADVNPDSLD